MSLGLAGLKFCQDVPCLTSGMGPMLGSSIFIAFSLVLSGLHVGHVGRDCYVLPALSYQLYDLALEGDP